MKDLTLQSKTSTATVTSDTPIASPKRSSTRSAPTHAEISRRAYEIFDKTGRRDGQCQLNWLQAECELQKPIETLASVVHVGMIPDLETFESEGGIVGDDSASIKADGPRGRDASARPPARSRRE